jgi:hypothetical protein
MTLTPNDLGLAPAGAARFDAYLAQVRAALAGSTDVSPDEVEASASTSATSWPARRARCRWPIWRPC